MLGLGTQEVLLVSLVLLLFFGPEKIPALSRKVGYYSAKVRREMQQMRDALESETAEGDAPGPKEPS